MKAKIGVYRFMCVASGRYYVGSSQNIAKRKRGHLRALREGRHHNVYFQRVFNKYGEESFEFKTIETDTVEEARELEQRLLDKHSDKSKCMNIGKHATGGDNITNNPNREKIVGKISKGVRAMLEETPAFVVHCWHSQPGRRNGMYGKTHTEKARRLISEKLTGQHMNKGVPKSDEHRRKMSENAKLRVGEKNPFFGKTHSDETKARLSKVHKARAADGVLPPNTRRVKIGKKTYRSLTDAGRVLGVVTATILYRIRSSNYPEYLYLD